MNQTPPTPSTPLTFVTDLTPEQRLFEATHIVIDIETLGTRPGSIILSIGAVAFNLELCARDVFLGEFYGEISVASCRAVGMGVDADTVNWWLDQKPEAISASLAGAVSQTGRPLSTVLDELQEFIAGLSLQYPIQHRPRYFYGNSSTFDLIHLEEAYARCGMPCPWTYQEEACLRTLLRLPFAPRPVMNNGEIKHHALDDARAEARALYTLLTGIRRMHEAPFTPTTVPSQP